MNVGFVLVGIFFLPGIPGREPGGQPGLVEQEFIYQKAPFAQCHASTLTETPTGLVAAWFGGLREGNPSVGIWTARREKGQWTAPVEAANGVQKDGKRFPCWNPVLFQPRSGPLMLFYKVGPSPQRWWSMLTLSEDGGRTWSEKRRLPDHILGPIKNKPIQLPSGDLLSGSSTEAPLTGRWRVHFEHSNDLGKTWSATPDLATGDQRIDAIQPTLLVHGKGKIQALGRTRSRKIFQAWSEDEGKSWGSMSLTDLPNPNSGIDAVTMADGRHVLIYNHTSMGRSPLNIAVSPDGIHWKAALVLEQDRGEYSYPAIIQTGDGLLHASYTWKRTRVKHVVMDPVKFVLKDMPAGQWPRP